LPQFATSLLPRIVNLSTLTAMIISAVPPAELLLPQRDETNRFLVCYCEHVDTLQHIIHVRSVRERFDFLYDVLENRRSETISGGLLALLLAVLAQTADFWAPGSPGGSFFSSRWLSRPTGCCALDAIEDAWRIESSNLEVVQVKILIMFSVDFLEGLSSKAGPLMAIVLPQRPCRNRREDQK